MPQAARPVTPEDDDLRAFSYPEVAQRLGLSLVTVKRLVYSGQLKSMHVGRRALIPAASLREFLAQGRS
jgi:excisionase family DNA binding protein